jgi:hypothetical protein
MSATEVIRAYHAGLHQADAAAQLGDVAAVRRAIATALDSARRAIIPAADCFAFAMGPCQDQVRAVSRAMYRAEDANAFMVIHQKYPGRDGEGGVVVLTHQPTGALLGSFHARADARAAAVDLLALPVDWHASTVLELRASIDRLDLQKAATTIVDRHSRANLEG